MIDTINKYNPLKSLSKSQESRERLMSAIFSNKELASEFANQITSKEAQIINRAAQRMGNDFSRLMKEYEQELLNEYVKSGKTNIDSIPKLYQELLNEIDKEAKARYKQSVSNLSSHLSDTDFKDTLLNSYIKMSDDAIQTLGMDNPLTATLLRETRKIEDKSFIGLNEAIELRKDINEILRNYDKQNSDLKKFKAHKHLEPLKQDIDNAIRTALDSKVAKSEMPNVILSDSEKSLNGSKRDVSPTAQQDNITSPQSLRGGVADEAIQKANNEAVATFIDKNGNTRIITKEVAENWKNTFGLKSIDDEAVVKIPQEVSNAIGKDIKINRKDLEKLIENHREQYIPNIKDTFENPHMAFIENNGDLIMAKPLDDKLFSVNVSRDYGESYLNVTLSPKKNNNILNKLNDAKEVIINYPPNFENTQPNQASTGFLSSTSKDSLGNSTQKTLTKQQADELFNEFINANLHYATTKEALNDKFAKAITKGMNKKDLDSRLTTEQWKQRVLDTNWGDSIKGLDNTIFKGFSPRMQEHTQMLFVFRALDRSVKGVQDNRVIDFEKLLGDLDSLEKLTLHPKVYAPLNLFREYAKVYRFSQELNNARGLESGVGAGALATTLEGRAKVFLVNRLFKKIFARIPYLGDNAALMNALSSAIGELKYPREISLKTLDLFKKHDEGIKPSAKPSANPHSQNLESNLDKSTPLSNIPRDTSNIRLATQDLENDIKAFSNDKDIITSEYKARYDTQANATKQEIETKGYATKEYLQEVFNDNDRYVMPNALKDDVKLKEAILDSIHENSIIYTPKNANIITKYNDETYITTINESGYVFTQISGKENVKPTSYMQLKELEKETQDIENQALKMIDKGMEKEKQRVESGESEKVIESNLNKEADLPSSLQGEAKAIHNTGQEISFNAPIKQIKTQMLERLKPIFNKEITSGDGKIKAYMSLKSLSKMTSNKAIQKSIDNGFSREEHLRAVLDIEKLFKQARQVKTHKDEKSVNENVLIHRLNSDIENGNALITTKESLDKNLNKMYSLELELIPRFNDEMRPTDIKSSKGDFSSQKHTADKSVATIAKTDKDDSTTKPQTTQDNLMLPSQDRDNVFTKEVENTHYYLDGKPILEIEDRLLSESGKRAKEAVLLEKEQINAVKKLNTLSDDEIGKFYRQEFMPNEYKIFEAYGLHTGAGLESEEKRFIQTAKMIDDIRVRNWYAQDLINRMKEFHKGGNKSSLYDKRLFKDLETIYEDSKKTIDEQIARNTQKLEAQQAEQRAKELAQKEADKKALLNTINSYDLESAYKHKAILEKAMQSNRNEYSPYSFGNAHNAEFLDELDLVEQRIRDLKKQHNPKVEPQAKQSKTEALKDYIDNARFQVDYAYQAGGKEVALNLIAQMIKDTKDTYQAKFLYRLKKEVQGLGETTPMPLRGEAKAIHNPNAQKEARKQEQADLQKESTPQTTRETTQEPQEQGKSIKETKWADSIDRKSLIQIRGMIKKDIAERQKNIKQGYIEGGGLGGIGMGKATKGSKYIHREFLETPEQKAEFLYRGFNKEDLDNYLKLVEQNAPLKERNKALDALVEHKLEQKSQELKAREKAEQLEAEQLAAFDEKGYIKSLKGKSAQELDDILGDLWREANNPNSSIPFPVVARMQNLTMWIQEGIPEQAFNNDKLREAIQDLRRLKEYKDDEKLIAAFKEWRELVESELNINPIKEFGTNYAEHYHSPKSAINKLLAEKEGQVSGAFYKEGLGDIDLVWGDSKKGLQHILERRTQDFINEGLSKKEADNKAIKLIDEMPNIIDESKIFAQTDSKIELITDKYTLVLGLRGDNKFVLTELIDKRNKKRVEAMQTGVGDSFTDEPLAKTPLSPNQHADSTTNPQTTQDIIKEAKASGKSVKETKQLIAENNAQKEASIFDDKSLSSTNTKQETKEAYKPFAPKDRISEYDTNLKNFLQDNHEITTITKSKKIQRGYKWVNQEVKEPRKFYHYTKESKLSEFDKEKDSSGLGFWFVSEPDNATPFAKELDKENKAMFGNSKKEVYLSIKNPFLDGVPISTTQITSQKEALKDLFKDNKKALGFIDSNPQSSVEKLLEHLEYSRGQSRAKEFKELLESKGYDSINFDMSRAYGGGMVVFNPTQIKAVGNKGSFDSSQANIYYANPSYIGSGFTGGVIAGIETDENGNITGFNPAKFAAGFLGGVVGHKALSSKTAQNHAKRAIAYIGDKYEPLMNNNPALFAQIMNKFKPNDFLKDKKGIDKLSDEIFNKELVNAIESAINSGKVETMPKAEFRNKEEFAALFDSINGNKGVINTPYGEVRTDISYAWEHFTENTYNTDRENIKGGFFSTFRDPLFVVEQMREGSTKPSVYFYKPFYDKEENVMNLFGIGIDSKGKVNFKTYYHDEKKNRIQEMLTSKKINIKYIKEV